MISGLLVLLAPMAMATFDPGTSRGEQVVQIPIANSNRAEICVIPKKYPQAVYSAKDLKSEQELCSLAGVEPAGLCPKLVSTNPAVEFFSVPESMTPAQLEARTCFVPKQDDPKDNQAKKMAKYKGSISCSYTPSLLAYYHISRILGDVTQVPPVVIRTMDLEKHKKVADKAVAALANSKQDLLKQIWAGVVSHLRAGKASSKKDALFTNDFTQTYGALQENPRKEEKYSEMFFSASGGGTRADAFRDRSPIYALLKNKRPARELVGNQWTKENVQKVMQMKDVADMIVLDTLLNQQDRFGNVHYTVGYMYLESGDGGMQVKRKNKMDEQQIRATGAVPVKMMMLKDNDCGVAKDNVAKKAGLLQGLSHMSSTTYAGLLRLQAEMATQESTRNFFMNETLMTGGDYSSVKQNLNEVVQTLQKACREGRLQLDLDLDTHFANRASNASCG